MSMTDTILEPDLELFSEDIFADGRWILVHTLTMSDPEQYPPIGTFASEDEARTFRNAYFPAYLVLQLKDPEDAIPRHGER